MERETPKKDALFGIALFNYWKDKVRFQKGGPKAYRIWETLG
jgi:hypothetical protein